jgi:protein-S-isoprenylcysteine O-methyltransferase Ste14
MRERKPPPPWARAILAVVNGAVPAVIVLAGAGGARPLVELPARAVGLALVVVYQIASAALSGLFVRPSARALESLWFVAPFQLLGFFMLIGLPICDVRGLAVLPESAAVRGAGLALTAIAFVLRLGPMVQLGRRFTPVVTRLPEHRLETGGFYGRLRHPSYLGMILLILGLALVFRSVVGLALVPVFVALLVWRMHVEERFLLEQFGDEYRAFAARRARLLPGVY